MKLVVGSIYSELHPPHTTREDRDVFRLSFERVQIFKSNKRRWLIGLNLLQITWHPPVSRNSSLTRSLLTAARMWIKAARWLWIKSETSSRAPLKNKKKPLSEIKTQAERVSPLGRRSAAWATLCAGSQTETSRGEKRKRRRPRPSDGFFFGLFKVIFSFPSFNIQASFQPINWADNRVNSVIQTETRGAVICWRLNTKTSELLSTARFFLFVFFTSQLGSDLLIHLRSSALFQSPNLTNYTLRFLINQRSEAVLENPRSGSFASVCSTVWHVKRRLGSNTLLLMKCASVKCERGETACSRWRRLWSGTCFSHSGTFSCITSSLSCFPTFTSTFSPSNTSFHDDDNIKINH